MHLLYGIKQLVPFGRKLHRAIRAQSLKFTDVCPGYKCLVTRAGNYNSFQAVFTFRLLNSAAQF